MQVYLLLTIVVFTRGGKMRNKKILTLLLAASIAASIAGCTPEKTNPSTSPEDGVNWPYPADGQYDVDYENQVVITGSVNAVLNPDPQGGEVTYNDVYSGVPGKDYTDKGFYTLNEYIASTNGMKWAPHTWETSGDAYILGYTTVGFYSFALNSSKTGWTIVDEMAVGAPEDVTQDYVGRYGIREGERAKAWKISLNPKACWDNGVAINADTYIYSYRELLNGKMMNRRADALYAGDFAVVNGKNYLYSKCGWEDVGILKTGDYELVFITESPIASPGFYVPYYLNSTFLVYEPLWEQCKTYFDSKGNQVDSSSADIASIGTDYCTSKETSISYGPYKLTGFERDKQITLGRNPLWYGYSDGKHFGQYQTDAISCQVIGNHASALLAFLRGEIDSIGLEAADMKNFAASDYIRYNPQTYTTKLSFNTDLQALSKRNAQVLTNVNFRRAFALAIDRSRFAASYTSAGTPGYGILNDLYVSDPFTGAGYRQSYWAKNALVQLYGLTYGEGGEYATLEDAYDAITGCDTALAQRIMGKAYEESVADGLYDGNSPITLRLSVYQSEDIYVQMYHFLREALETACRGTGFEGKVSLEMVEDADYYETMESGLTDIIFSTWGGSAFEPYSLLYQCYCDRGAADFPNQMEYGFDASGIRVHMQISGKNYVNSLQNWARYCSGDPAVTIASEDGSTKLNPFSDYDADTKSAIYANLEYAYLSQYAVTPLYYRNSAMLISQKGDYAVKEYLNQVAFGGLRFYTYHYTDEQWEKVKGNLTYG